MWAMYWLVDGCVRVLAVASNEIVLILPTQYTQFIAKCWLDWSMHDKCFLIDIWIRSLFTRGVCTNNDQQRQRTSISSVSCADHASIHPSIHRSMLEFCPWQRCPVKHEMSHQQQLPTENNTKQRRKTFIWQTFYFEVGCLAWLLESWLLAVHFKEINVR